ncbi:MAG: FimB/Mfa2 family fimbrial subunit, partial [Alistipes sp.]|nr:FimB/Mfa2 family fimbrial subunit [Alistipes sp.]
MKFRFLALLALVLGLASCQNDPYGLEVDSKGEAAVTLNVALPDDATRAAGADSAKGAIGNVDLDNAYDIRFILEVYNLDGSLAKERMTEVKDTETSASFSFRLVPGRNYKFVVWADFVNQGSDGEDDLHYDTSAGLDEVKVKMANWKVIDESRDAYTGFKVVENFSSLSALTEPITLTRPFAKLRVVTNDIKEMISVRPAVVKVNYFNTKFYNTFDAFSAEAKNLVDAPANLTAILADDTYTGEKPEETGVQTLFADYFFGAENDRVMFYFDVQDNGGVDLPQVTFNTNIPVQRNYLTTIYGPILTDANNITVTINDAFENGPDWNPEEDEYDVELISGTKTETVVLKAGKYFFKNVTVTTTTGPAIKIEENAVVTIDVQGILKLAGATDGIAVPNSS